MVSRPGLAAVLAAVFLPMPDLAAGDWPCWRGPERNGIAAAGEAVCLDLRQP